MVLVSQRHSDRTVPKLGDFAALWVRSSTPSWKASYLETVKYTLDRWILPTFQDWMLDHIDREALLEYRAAVVAHERRPSPARVNKIMSILGSLLTEASARYGFENPASGIRRLRERSRDIQPFTLAEVNQLLLEAPPEWRDYYGVRFFTGMRTAEIDGLRWRYVDFKRRQILVRETVVLSRPDTTKNESSEREIDMVPLVHDALIRQWRRTGERGEYVFCARNGSPLRHGNMRKRVWLPLLKGLGLGPRRQYETRHTYATLMLAAGENPEYIRRQMGHSTTEMLFSVYSRYVPNLTRRDGSAFEQMLGVGSPADKGAELVQEP